MRTRKGNSTSRWTGLWLALLPGERHKQDPLGRCKKQREHLEIPGQKLRLWGLQRPGGGHSELVVLIASLEVENQSLKGAVRGLQQAIIKPAAQLSVQEKSVPAHRATNPQTQHVSPMRQVESPPRRQPPPQRKTRVMTSTCLAVTRRTRRPSSCGRSGCWQYAKAKKPALVARSSVLLDVKPWDDQTDMAQLEACWYALCPAGWADPEGLQAGAGGLWHLQAADPVCGGGWQGGNWPAGRDHQIREICAEHWHCCLQHGLSPSMGLWKSLPLLKTDSWGKKINLI